MKASKIKIEDIRGKIKKQAKEKNKRIITRTLDEIITSAKSAMEGGADWWQFHEHRNNTD